MKSKITLLLAFTLLTGCSGGNNDGSPGTPPPESPSIDNSPGTAPPESSSIDDSPGTPSPESSNIDDSTGTPPPEPPSIDDSTETPPPESSNIETDFPTSSGNALTAQSSTETSTFSLDVDGNGDLNGPNDGLIIFKYLLNPNANNLHTTVANDANRRTTKDLKAYLDTHASILDVDGNGDLNAPNDGLIIFKYLLNPNANNLHTTIANDALEGRRTTKELKDYLDMYASIPPPTPPEAPSITIDSLTLSGDALTVQSPTADWSVTTNSTYVLDHYEVSLGTASESSDIIGWTNIGTNTQHIFSSISPALPDFQQDYFFNVRAVSSTGAETTSSASWRPSITSDLGLVVSGTGTQATAPSLTITTTEACGFDSHPSGYTVHSLIEFAVGTAPGSDDVSPWTPTSALPWPGFSQTTWSVAANFGVSTLLKDTDYWYSVRTTDSNGSVAVFFSESWQIVPALEVIWADSSPIAEEGNQKTLVLELSEVQTTDTTMFLTTEDDTAFGDTSTLTGDFKKIDTQSHVIPAGSTSTSVVITTNKDNIHEPNENFKLKIALSSANTNIIGPADVDFTITNSNVFYLNEDVSITLPAGTLLSDIDSVGASFMNPHFSPPEAATMQFLPEHTGTNTGSAQGQDYFNYSLVTQRATDPPSLSIENNQLIIPSEFYFIFNGRQGGYNLPLDAAVTFTVTFTDITQNSVTRTITTLPTPELHETIKSQSTFAATGTHTDWFNRIQWPRLSTYHIGELAKGKTLHKHSHATDEEIYGAGVNVLIFDQIIAKSSNVYDSVVFTALGWPDRIVDFVIHEKIPDPNNSFPYANAINPNLGSLESYALYNHGTQMARYMLNYAPKVNIYDSGRKTPILGYFPGYPLDIAASNPIDILSLSGSGLTDDEVRSTEEGKLKDLIDKGLVLSISLGNTSTTTNEVPDCGYGDEALFTPYIHDLSSSSGGIITLQAVVGGPLTSTYEPTYESLRTLAGSYAKYYTLSILETGSGATSQATATFSGIMALMIEANTKYNRTYTNKELLGLIVDTAQYLNSSGVIDTTADSDAVDNVFGHGLVNIEAALQAVEDGSTPVYDLYSSGNLKSGVTEISDCTTP